MNIKSYKEGSSPTWATGTESRITLIILTRTRCCQIESISIYRVQQGRPPFTLSTPVHNNDKQPFAYIYLCFKLFVDSWKFGWDCIRRLSCFQRSVCTILTTSKKGRPCCTLCKNFALCAARSQVWWSRLLCKYVTLFRMVGGMTSGGICP